MTELKDLRRAGLYHNDDFICVQTYSGYRSSSIDLNGKMILLPSRVDAEELGYAVIAALTASRVISIEEIASYRDLDRLREVSLKWRSKIMGKYGYKKEAQIFKNMKFCTVQANNCIIEFTPTIHEKKDSWVGTGLDGEDRVTVLHEDSMGKIGQAALLALARSTG